MEIRDSRLERAIQLFSQRTLFTVREDFLHHGRLLAVLLVAVEGLNMERQSVLSTSLRSAGYDAATETLEIEFQSGDVYQYLRVPVHIYEALLMAPSKGSYFQTHIKPRYSYREVG